MSRRIRDLQQRLIAMNRDMWTLTDELCDAKAKTKRLQDIIYRQDATIMALWIIIEAAEKKERA